MKRHLYRMPYQHALPNTDELEYVCPDIDIMQVCANLATSPAELLQWSLRLKKLMLELDTNPEVVLRDMAHDLVKIQPEDDEACFVWTEDYDSMTIAHWSTVHGWNPDNTEIFQEPGYYPYWLSLNKEAR